MLKEIRRARQDDCPKILELLEYICALHSGIRPDLFKAGKSKYDGESLKKLLTDESRLIFVAADENDRVLGYIFCIIIDHSADSARCPNTELYIDDLCVDEKFQARGHRRRTVSKGAFDRTRARLPQPDIKRLGGQRQRTAFL